MSKSHPLLVYHSTTEDTYIRAKIQMTCGVKKPGWQAKRSGVKQHIRQFNPMYICGSRKTIQRKIETLQM